MAADGQYERAGALWRKHTEAQVKAEDLQFSATIYGLGAGLFFVAYAVFEVPSSLMLRRYSAPQWIARIMITWGLLSAGMMFVRTPTQFYVMRFLLGMAEAGFFPSVIYYFSSWLPPSAGCAWSPQRRP